MEAEAQRERLEALRIHTRPLDTPEVGEEAQMPPGVRRECGKGPVKRVREFLEQRGSRT